MAAPLRPNGGKKEKFWREALMVAIKRTDDEGRVMLAKIAKRVVDLAEAGDMQAVKEIGDRLDGKPALQVMHDGGDSPIKIVAVWGGLAKDEDSNDPYGGSGI